MYVVILKNVDGPAQARIVEDLGIELKNGGWLRAKLEGGTSISWPLHVVESVYEVTHDYR